jgi:hypothetical protein
VFREEAIYRSIHAVENGYPIHNALEMPAEPDRPLGIGRSRRQTGHRGLARAV